MFPDDQPDFSIRTTQQLEPGMTVQFTEGDWESGHVPGIVISAEAFDVVQEAIEAHLPGIAIDPYGVTKLPEVSVAAVVEQLRLSATKCSHIEAQALMLGVADYVEGVRARGLPLTVLGY